ncbi:MAG: hypothetical protein K2X69_11700 [Silvanigrellaceae bacterium]|jgi:signal recognition particle receptor subunit beta|nr:hypothetical protein [Silvanigrellaceae bacterium]
MEDKNKKGYVKIDFDLTNKLDKAVYDFFQKMYFGYKKKFVVACARKYLKHNSDQMKELLDDLELNMSHIAVNLNETQNAPQKLEKNTYQEEIKTENLSSNIQSESFKKTNSSKLFKKT